MGTSLRMLDKGPSDGGALLLSDEGQDGHGAVVVRRVPVIEDVAGATGDRAAGGLV